MSEHDDETRDLPEDPPAAQPQVPGTVSATPSEQRRLLPGWNRPDPRKRPRDPAGTFPRFEPDELLPPADAEPLTIHAESPLAPSTTAAAGLGGPSVAPAAASDAGEPPDAARFQFALGALIAVAVAGVLLLLVAALDKNDKSSSQTFELTGPRWSAWAPYQGSIDGPTQIADHVGAKYKLPDGHQLVAITGGPLEIAGLPLTVALRQPPASGGGIQLYEGKGVLYRLCGLGDRCAIASGQPSIARRLLLNREALELALYSFRYLKGVSQVVVFMPPRKGMDPSQALFLRPQDVAQQLSLPLTDTISPRTPSVHDVRRSPGIATIDQLTDRSTFKFSLTQGNADLRAFLVLDRLTG